MESERLTSGERTKASGAWRPHGGTEEEGLILAGTAACLFHERAQWARRKQRRPGGSRRQRRVYAWRRG